MIDVVSFLDACGVDYRLEGKNVAKGDVNVCCIYCPESAFHLGIDKKTGVLNCWRCELDVEPRPRLMDFVAEYLSISVGEAWDLAKPFNTLPGWQDQGSIKKEEVKRPKEATWPEGTQRFDIAISKRQRDKALAYLEERQFGWKEIEKYKLRFCTSGEYRYRIIIPVYYGDKMVTYTGRDYLNNGDKERSRYKHCYYELSALTANYVLYGYEQYLASGSDWMRILEGPTDRWRLGDISVAAFTNKLSKRQISLVVKAKPKAVSIIYDRNSFDKAHKAAGELSAFVRWIKVVRMPTEEQDVGKSTFEEVMELEKDTNCWRF